MAYTAFDGTKPDAATQAGTAFGQSTRDNLLALRDMAAAGHWMGATVAISGGIAAEPTQILWSKGTERLRATITWGTTGGEDGNITQVIWAYSSDSGGGYDTIDTLTATYDSNGYQTAGHQLTKLIGGWTGRMQGAETRLTALEAASGATMTTFSAFFYGQIGR